MTHEDNVNEILSYIEKSKQHYNEITQRYILDACDGKIFMATFFMLGLINRQVELLDGINYVINSKNINVGGGLLRMLLENFYFIFYIYGFIPHVDSEWLSRFTDDGRLSLINEQGKKIRVKEIDMVNNLLKQYPKFENIYEETCKFAHFSNKHLFNFMEGIGDIGAKGELSMKIGVGSDYRYQSAEFINYIQVVVEIDSELRKFLVGLVNYLEVSRD